MHQYLKQKKAQIFRYLKITIAILLLTLWPFLSRWLKNHFNYYFFHLCHFLLYNVRIISDIFSINVAAKLPENIQQSYSPAVIFPIFNELRQNTFCLWKFAFVFIVSQIQLLCTVWMENTVHSIIISRCL